MSVLFAGPIPPVAESLQLLIDLRKSSFARIFNWPCAFEADVLHAGDELHKHADPSFSSFHVFVFSCHGVFCILKFCHAFVLLFRFQFLLLLLLSLLSFVSALFVFFEAAVPLRS